jgi:hypothetical protein
MQAKVHNAFEQNEEQRSPEIKLKALSKLIKTLNDHIVYENSSAISIIWSTSWGKGSSKQRKC